MTYLEQQGRPGLLVLPIARDAEYSRRWLMNGIFADVAADHPDTTIVSLYEAVPGRGRNYSDDLPARRRARQDAPGRRHPIFTRAGGATGPPDAIWARSRPTSLTAPPPPRRARSRRPRRRPEAPRAARPVGGGHVAERAQPRRRRTDRQARRRGETAPRDEGPVLRAAVEEVSQAALTGAAKGTWPGVEAEGLVGEGRHRMTLPSWVTAGPPCQALPTGAVIWMPSALWSSTVPGLKVMPAAPAPLAATRSPVTAASSPVAQVGGSRPGRSRQGQVVLGVPAVEPGVDRVAAVVGELDRRPGLGGRRRDRPVRGDEQARVSSEDTTKAVPTEGWPFSSAVETKKVEGSTTGVRSAMATASLFWSISGPGPPLQLGEGLLLGPGRSSRRRR